MTRYRRGGLVNGPGIRDDEVPAVLSPAFYEFTGHTNAVHALAAAVQSLGGKIDEQSFDRLAELRGDAPVDESFVVRGYEDVQRLCEIANVVVSMDPESGLVKAYEPEEFVPVEERF